MRRLFRLVTGLTLGIALGVIVSTPIVGRADNGAIFNLVEGAKLMALDGYKLVLGAEDGADGGVEINIEGAVQYTFNDGDITPGTNSDVDLGTAVLSYEDIFAEKLYLDNDTIVALDADVVTATTAAPLLAVGGASATQSHAAFVQNVASTAPVVVDFLKTRAASGAYNANTIISNGDDIALFNFWGANGTAYDKAAQLLVESAAAPGASTDMPGHFIFKTTPDGSATPVEALRIASTGVVTAAAGLTATTGDVIVTSGDVSLVASGKTLEVETGTAASACFGTSTANGTTAVTVTTTCAVTGSLIFISNTGDPSGNAANVNACWATNIQTGVSFDIDCADADMNQTLVWGILHEAP